jgi:NTP pyrophosphatase (non-canonical NTP hydrolase)
MITLKPQPTLADLQQFVTAHCKARGWDKRSTLEKMLFLTEEVGEVADAIRQLKGIASKKVDSPDHLASELVDVFNYILDLAEEYHIDFEAAFRAKWTYTETRTWPDEK